MGQEETLRALLAHVEANPELDMKYCGRGRPAGQVNTKPRIVTPPEVYEHLEGVERDRARKQWYCQRWREINGSQRGTTYVPDLTRKVKKAGLVMVSCRLDFLGDVPCSEVIDWAHLSYADPLDVLPLCRAHHSIADGKYGYGQVLLRGLQKTWITWCLERITLEDSA